MQEIKHKIYVKCSCVFIRPRKEGLSTLKRKENREILQLSDILFQQPYHPQFPQLGLKNQQQLSTSPVPQNKHMYTKKTNQGKPFEHLPNIWLFGQGVMRHDGNWASPTWRAILEAIFIWVFGSNGALNFVCECDLYICTILRKWQGIMGSWKTKSHWYMYNGAMIWRVDFSLVFKTGVLYKARMNQNVLSKFVSLFWFIFSDSLSFSKNSQRKTANQISTRWVLLNCLPSWWTVSQKCLQKKSL